MTDNFDSPVWLGYPLDLSAPHGQQRHFALNVTSQKIFPICHVPRKENIVYTSGFMAVYDQSYFNH